MRSLLLVLALAAAAVAGWFWLDGRKPAPEVAQAPPAPTTIVAAPLAAPVQPATVAQPAPDAVDVEAMREASLRAARQQTIRVQQRLRAEAAAERAKKAQAKTSDVRCVDGQQLKRVPNGWVEDGKC
jgi:hypothetical protein